MKISDILDQIDTVDESEAEAFLLRNCENSLAYRQIKQILEHEMVDDSGPIIHKINELASDCIRLTRPENYIGQHFGQWKATEVINSTNKSIVLLGKPIHDQYGQKVAIKILSPTFEIKSQDSHSQMQAHYMEKLKHPNMVEMKSAGINSDNVNYVVMEFLEKGNLIIYANQNNLSFKKRIKIFLDVCSCIINMHNKSVVHADLKPDNILINELGVPKIIDLDLAIAINSHINDKYNFENIKGYTNNFASPEQFNNPEKVSNATDVFSLGRLFSVLVAGETDFDNFEKFKKEISNKFSKVKFLPEIYAIINKATQSSPEDRYQSVFDFQLDLVTYLEGKEITRAYKSSAKSTYKAFRYILARKVKLSFATICIILALSVIYSIDTEKKKIKEELETIIRLNNPADLKGEAEFFNKADVILNETNYIQEEHFEQLMDIGNAIFEKGKIEIAIKFFEKAYNIYDDLYSVEKIRAACKIAQIKTSSYLNEEANKYLTPYIQLFDRKNLDEPHLIEALITYIDINLRSSGALEENLDNDVLDLLNSISNENFTGDEKVNFTVKHELYKALTRYYQIPFGDFASVLVNRTPEELQNEIYPALYEVKDSLYKSYANSKLTSSPYTPILNTWLGRVEGELGNTGTANTFVELGIEQTIRIFGMYHQRTVDAYLKKYAINRYINTDIAVDAIRNANRISKKLPGYQDTKYFLNIILFEALIQNSIEDFQEILSTMNDNYTKYYKGNQLISNLWQYQPMYNQVTELTELVHIFPSIFKKYIKFEVQLDRNSKQSKKINDGEPWYFTDVLQLNFNFEKYINNEDYKSYQKEIDDSFENLINYKDGQYLEEPGINELITLAEHCVNIPNCNPNIYIQAFIDRNNVNHFEKLSNFNLVVHLKLINVLIKIDETQLAKEFLNKLPIIKPNNYLYGLYLLFKLEIKKEIEQSDSDMLEQAENHLMKAFGKNHDLIERVNLLRRKLRI